MIWTNLMPTVNFPHFYPAIIASHHTTQEESQELVKAGPNSRGKVRKRVNKTSSQSPGSGEVFVG